MTILLDLVDAVGDQATGIAVDAGGVIHGGAGALKNPVTGTGGSAVVVFL
jgi:hypothetical protein